MPISSEKLLADLDQFIAGDRRQEEMLFWRLFRREKLPEKDYFQVISHLNQRQDIASSKEEEARILVALALFKLLSPWEPPAGIQHLQTAILQGNSVALALFKLLSPLSPSRNERLAAIQHLETAIQQGNSFAIGVMGYCYQQGIVVAKDPAKAVVLYQQAVVGGNVTAAFNLGICYEKGYGVAKDPAKAVKFYQQAAVGGSAAAACSLGFCYQLGIGVAKDPVKAVELYQKAVDGGSDVAACNLGDCYTYGVAQDVAQDQVKAISLFISAINATNDLEVSHRALKWLQACLNSTPALAPVDFAAVAKCCAVACKQFPQSEGCKTAKEILQFLTSQTNNFEVHYWATLATPVWGETAFNFLKFQTPIEGLIKSDPDAFVNCLLKDDVHTLAEKEKIYSDYCKLFSGRGAYLIFNAQGKLREERNNPNSFFKLLPTDLYESFAKNITPKPAEATTPIPAPSPKPGG